MRFSNLIDRKISKKKSQKKEPARSWSSTEIANLIRGVSGSVKMNGVSYLKILKYTIRGLQTNLPLNGGKLSK